MAGIDDRLRGVDRPVGEQDINKGSMSRLQV
jgi:hypothetical protein